MSSFEHIPLKELGCFKDALVEQLFNQEDLRSLIMPQLDDEDFSAWQNWCGGSYTLYHDDGTIRKTANLPGHCLNVPYPDSITGASAAILIETGVSKAESRCIQNIAITISPCSHKDFIHMEADTRQLFESKGYFGNRIDMAVSAIHAAVSEKNFATQFGIGQLSLAPGDDPIQSFMPCDNIYGKTITYSCSGFYSPSGRKESR